MPALADPEFAAGIRRHAQDVLQRSRGIPGAFHSLIVSPEIPSDG